MLDYERTFKAKVRSRWIASEISLRQELKRLTNILKTTNVDQGYSK